MLFTLEAAVKAATTLEPNHRADGSDGIIERHRNADGEHVLYAGGIQIIILTFCAEYLKAAEHVKEAQHGGEPLRDNRCQGCAGGSESCGHNQKDIEHNVEHG